MKTVFRPSKECDKLSGSNLGMQLIMFNYALYLLGYSFRILQGGDLMGHKNSAIFGTLTSFIGA